MECPHKDSKTNVCALIKVNKVKKKIKKKPKRNIINLIINKLYSGLVPYSQPSKMNSQSSQCAIWDTATDEPSVLWCEYMRKHTSQPLPFDDGLKLDTHTHNTGKQRVWEDLQLMQEMLPNREA